MEDDSIYNAIIIALIAGIIIVALTLIFARPPEESFTELYINNHKNLPKYVENNKDYQFSFTLANHENKDVIYNYSVQTSLFEFDRSCEAPSIHFENIDLPSYNNYLNLMAPLPKIKPINQLYFEEPSLYPTKQAFTDDPSTLIKADEYTITYNYRVKAGDGQLVTELRGLNNEKLFTFIINEKTQKAFLNDFQNSKFANLNITPRQQHRVEIRAAFNGTEFLIDNKLAFFINEIHSKGFLSFETTQTFAEVTGLNVNQNEKTQGIRATFTDQLTETDALNSGRIKEREMLFSNSGNVQVAQLGDYINVTRYVSERELNMSDYAMEMQFRGNKLSLGLQNTYELLYNTTHFIAMKKNSVSIIPINQSRVNIKNLRIVVDNRQASVYFNGKKITEIPDIFSEYEKVFVKTYDTEVYVKSFVARNELKPHSKTFIFTEGVTPLTQGAGFVIGKPVFANETNPAIPINLYQSEEISWQSYALTGRYQNRQGFIDLKVDNSYQFHVDHLNNTAFLTINGSTKEYEIAPGSGHDFIIDTKQGLISIAYDNEIIFTEQLDNPAGKMILDHSNDVFFEDIIIQDRNSSEVKLHDTGETKCSPILKAKYSIDQSIAVKKGNSIQLNKTVSFTDTFDIASVSVILGQQELHFWVVGT